MRKKYLYTRICNLVLFSCYSVISYSQATEYIFIEKMPEFPGGEQALRSYIKNEIKYPPELKDIDIIGKVYVQFVIDEQGNVTNAKVVKGLNEFLDKEALRVVSGLPKFTPGEQNGKKVRVYYTVPVKFEIYIE